MLDRQFAKLCDLADFEDPELVALMDDIAPTQADVARHRKRWELAMGARFLEATGRLDGDASILDVGAGRDLIAYWLTNRASRVTAIDLYGQGAFGGREAERAMLEDPASLAPYAYAEDRLEVRDMDARTLEFPDASFDAVVSFSSIEHFGGRDDIRAAAREIGRVLKPGGHAVIVTEVFVDQHPIDHAPILFALRVLSGGRRCRDSTLRRRGIGDVLSQRELQQLIVGPSGLELMQPLQTTVSPETLANPFVIGADGVAVSLTGAVDPHIVLRTHRSLFTSVCLPLVKRAR